MQRARADGELVDIVWAVANDGKWHSVEGLAKRVPGSRTHLAKIVEFLLKYGFAEPSPCGPTRFRLNAECPAPGDIAESLNALATSALGLELLRSTDEFSCS